MCDLARKAQVHDKSAILQFLNKMGWTLLTSRKTSQVALLEVFSQMTQVSQVQGNHDSFMDLWVEYLQDRLTA